MMMDEDVPEEEDVDSTTAIEGNNEERASGSHDEDRNNAATNAAAVSTSTTTTTTAPSKEQKRRRRALKPRRRDSKAPRPPRTALELYQVDSRKDFIRKHGAASIPKDFAAQKAASFERLSFQTIQQWKVAEAEDLVRYQRQLQHYHPPPGYDPFGNLIVEDDDDDEDSEANTKKQKVNDSSAPANATTNSSILDAPGDPSKVSATPSPHLTLATASFTDLTYELTKFRIKKGHCRVPLKRGGILGKWVDRIRKEYRKIRGNDSIIMPSQSLPDNVRLTEERIQVLSHLGMVWEFPNEDYEEIWQNHFRQLVEFKEKNGCVGRAKISASTNTCVHSNNQVAFSLCVPATATSHKRDMANSHGGSRFNESSSSTPHKITTVSHPDQGHGRPCHNTAFDNSKVSGSSGE
jgi:hypothetical protein